MSRQSIGTLSILNALYNLRRLDAAPLPSDQARQVLQHLLQKTTIDAFNGHPIYKDMDWEDENFLPFFCAFSHIKKIVSIATSIAEPTLSFSLTLEFLYKISATLWQHHLPTLTYPNVVLDPTARQRFKDTLKNEAAFKTGDYPLDDRSIGLIASIIDTYLMRSFQKNELQALDISSGDPLNVLKHQPRLSSLVVQEIQHFISGAVSTASLSKCYAAIAHGYVTAASQDNMAQAPTLVYSAPVATLIKDYLLTGVKPHRASAVQWTSLQLSLYEDIKITPDDEVARVSSADLLISDPINYSDFKLHPFQPITITALENLLERLDQLLSLYHASVANYWQAPTAQTGAKKVWVDCLKHYVETEARLRLADNTLDLKSYTSINHALSAPSAAQRVDSSIQLNACVLVDKATSRRFRMNGMFLIIDHPTPKSEPATVVVFDLACGTQVFDSWTSFEQDLLNTMKDYDSREGLLSRMNRNDASAIAAFYSPYTEQLGVEKTAIATDFITFTADQLLLQQKEDFIWNFTRAKKDDLPSSLSQFCTRVDTSLEFDFGLDKKHFQLSALRSSRIIQRLPNKTLSYAWALQSNTDQSDFSHQHLLPLSFDLPELNEVKISDRHYRQALINKLTSTETVNAIQALLTHITPYLFAETLTAVTSSAQILKKVIRHRLDLVDFNVVHLDSLRYKYFYLHQYVIQRYGKPRAKLIIDSASLVVLDVQPPALQTDYPFYWSEELDTAQNLSPDLVPHLRVEIGAKQSGVDLKALATYLEADLLAVGDPAVLQGDQDALYYRLIIDSPGFHKLANSLIQVAPAKLPKSVTYRRALALSVITDYLSPPDEHKPGYIAGLNLNSIDFGESSVNRVRELIAHHLKQRFADSTDRVSQRLAFTLLCARHAPELLITGVPDTLLYGQSLDAVHFRHAVACMEAIHPCSALTMTFKDMAAAYQNYNYRQLTETQKFAVALLKQLPTLHFSMCQGIIPETEIAFVSHDDSLKAVEYLKQQETLEAQTFTHLAQIPPQRKVMAKIEFDKANPGVDSEQSNHFSKAEVKKYFFTHPAGAADSHVGERMKMTRLEKYMTCANGLAFTEQELGVTPYPRGACTLQSLFDQKFTTFKDNFLKGMVSQLCLSLQALPTLDRDRVLKAYKFLTVSFQNAEQKWEVSPFGMIALYKESESVQYAYEIFCLSGTIRPLGLTGQNPTRIYMPFGPDSRDELWHELSVLKIPLLNEGAYMKGAPDQQFSAARLTVSFYTVRRQTNTMGRNEKIQFLSQKMVDSVFGTVTELAYSILRSPTPFEKHKDRVFARFDTLARFIFPGYSLYQDIKNNKVTVGTIIFGALEVLSLLIPFVGLGFKALRISSQLAFIAVSSSSLGLSRQLMALARTIKPLQSAVPRAFFSSVKAANPLGAVVMLFQAGHKGWLAFKFLLKFTRQELGKGRQLSPLVKTTHLRPPMSLPIVSLDSLKPGAATVTPRLKFFKADLSSSAHSLNIQQQYRFYVSGIDLSTTTPVNGIYSLQQKTYIYLQSHIYEVRKIANTDNYKIFKDTAEGPTVNFNNTRNRWEMIC